MLDRQTVSLCTLVGLAKAGALSARTPESLILINELAEHNDYRESLDNNLIRSILIGFIRTDANWSNGIDEQLLRLVEFIFTDEVIK